VGQRANGLNSSSTVLNGSTIAAGSSGIVSSGETQAASLRELAGVDAPASCSRWRARLPRTRWQRPRRTADGQASRHATAGSRRQHQGFTQTRRAHGQDLKSARVGRGGNSGDGGRSSGSSSGSRVAALQFHSLPGGECVHVPMKPLMPFINPGNRVPAAAAAAGQPSVLLLPLLSAAPLSLPLVCPPWHRHSRSNKAAAAAGHSAAKRRVFQGYGLARVYQGSCSGCFSRRRQTWAEAAAKSASCLAVAAAVAGPH